MAALGHADRLRRKGFQNVVEKHLHCPLGPWAKGERQKKLGWMGRKDLYEGIEGISKRLFIMMGDSEEQVDEFLEKCKLELMDSKVSLYQSRERLSRTFAKPLEDPRLHASVSRFCCPTRPHLDD
jgi:hypothetical protein